MESFVMPQPSVRGELPEQTLLRLLEEFEGEVSRIRQAAGNLVAERALNTWERALDGEAVLPSRCRAGRLSAAGFHRGMELRSSCQLDGCRLPAGPESFEAALAEQKAALLQALEAQEAGGGRRPSSHTCDATMVCCARFSRFLGVWALGAEMRLHGEDLLESTLPAGGELWRPRWASPPLAAWRTPERRIFAAMLAWEPQLNRLIGAWEGNLLTEFLAAAQQLRQSISQGKTPALRDGEPFREPGARRWRVETLSLNGRPLTPRPSLHVRFKRLQEKLLASPPQAARAEEVALEMCFVLGMFHQRRCQLALQPGFQMRELNGRPVIRGRVRNHRWLLEPLVFFKQASLFRNGAYTRQGEGHNTLFLELRQFQRWLHFQPPTEENIPQLLRLGQQALIAWEENRWQPFNHAIHATARALLVRAGLDLPDEDPQPL